MKINADHYHAIGSTHHFCQDFSAASCQETQQKAYTLVCDGCSSVPDSHIGALLLGKAAEHFVYPVELAREDMTIRAVTVADTYRKAMDLPQDVLSSTLLTIALTKTHFLVGSSGDGVIVCRKRTGELSWMTLVYTSGAPWYPRYALSPEVEAGYEAEFPGQYCRTLYDESGGLTVFDDKDAFRTHTYMYSLDEFDAVGVLSDGAMSFYSREVNGTCVRQQPIDIADVVRDLFAFKGTQGEFVKRRCLRVLREYAHNQKFNADDLSVGVVTCE